MPSKKTSRKDFDLSEARLYLVLDRQVCGYDRLFEILEESAAFGVDVVQLRDKHGEARETLAFARAAVRSLKKRVPFIVNDRADIALLSGAAGVHVGQDDLSCREARSLLGPSAVIGVSCQTLAHAAKAQKDGADYIGFGSVFKTRTKPDRDPMDLALLSRAVRTIRIPVFAIGGIELRNVGQVLQTGITRIAVTRAVCQAQDAGQAVRDFRKKLPS